MGGKEPLKTICFLISASLGEFFYPNRLILTV